MLTLFQVLVVAIVAAYLTVGAEVALFGWLIGGFDSPNRKIDDPPTFRWQRALLCVAAWPLFVAIELRR